MKTTPEVFHEIVGKAPLPMKQDIPGFGATRLQEALWHQALHRVDKGETTPENTVIALMNGPVPLMLVHGQSMADDRDAVDGDRHSDDLAVRRNREIAALSQVRGD